MDKALALDRRCGAAAPGPIDRLPQDWLRQGAAAVLLAALLLPAAAVAATEQPGDDDPARPDPETRIVIQEQLTVTDTRLRAAPESLRRVPAHVTVIDRDEIRRSGSRTLQELLSLEAGVVVFDQVGNDLARSLDLRGFTGAGTKLFL
ncbi:MAG: TonB-dependent receptor plug domain-containing protein, partial [Thermoanaerobaculia bacterium]